MKTPERWHAFPRRCSQSFVPDLMTFCGIMTLYYDVMASRDIKVHTSTKFWVDLSNGLAVSLLTDGQTDRLTGPILYPRPLTREGTKRLVSEN